MTQEINTTTTRLERAQRIALSIACIDQQCIRCSDYRQLIKFVEKLHSGKHGSVSAVLVRALNMRIAVKSQPAELDDKPGTFDIWSEACIMGVLTRMVQDRVHPCFPITYTWCQVENAGYTNSFKLLMEASVYSTREWFKRLLARPDSPFMGSVYTFVMQSMTALLALGAAGISNNDLYDRNILIEATNERVITVRTTAGEYTFRTHGLLFKLADFGMASSPQTGGKDFTPEYVHHKNRQHEVQVDTLARWCNTHVIYVANIPPAARDLVTLLWTLLTNSKMWKNSTGLVVYHYARTALMHVNNYIHRCREGVFSFEYRARCIHDLLSESFMNVWPAYVRSVNAEDCQNAATYIIPHQYESASVFKVPPTCDAVKLARGASSTEIDTGSESNSMMQSPPSIQSSSTPPDLCA